MLSTDVDFNRRVVNPTALKKKMTKPVCGQMERRQAITKYYPCIHL